MVTKSTCVVLEGVGATSQPIDSADQNLKQRSRKIEELVDFILNTLVPYNI